MSTSEDITVDQTKESVSASTVIEAPAARIFGLLRRPAEHPRINGDGSVRGASDGPDELGPGSRFGMRMRHGVPYRIHSTVVEYEADRVIAWQHLGGHRWIWRLEPVDAGHTKVTETFDLSTAKSVMVLHAIGYPGRHRTNVVRSVGNLKRLAEASSGRQP